MSHRTTNCSACGAEVAYSAENCQNCGASVRRDPREASIHIGFIFFAIGFIFWYLFTPDVSSRPGLIGAVVLGGFMLIGVAFFVLAANDVGHSSYKKKDDPNRETPSTDEDRVKSMSDEIEKLAELREDGKITDAEFDAFTEQFELSTGKKAKEIVDAISDLYDEYKQGAMTEGNYHSALWSLMDKMDRES